MTYRRIPCVFMRGGTSKALVFHARDLPEDRTQWAPLFLRTMGSPDPNGRQLDGMGGGISSLSKVCVVGPPSREDADLDYSFFQIGVDDDLVDESGNCGNMSSAMGPFALDEGIAGPATGAEAAIRIHNTNTKKIILSRFPVVNGRAAVTGEQRLDGVSGSGAPVRLEFLDPGGAGTGRLLPADGAALTELDVPGVGKVEASMIDAANPCVFVDAASLGMTATEHPEAIEADRDLMDRLEAIRRAASIRMGIAPDAEAAGRIPSIPKVALVAAPQPVRTLSGTKLLPGDYDIAVRMISIGKPHRAIPLTGGLCVGVALRTAGSLPHRLTTAGDGPIRVGHPSGVLVVDAEVDTSGDAPRAVHGAVYRTTRRLFEGVVMVPEADLAPASSEVETVA